MATRKEHLEWCKQRALEYVDAGNTSEAFASFLSDMNKHPETQGHSALQLGAILLFSGFLSTERQMRDWITGFN